MARSNRRWIAVRLALLCASVLWGLPAQSTAAADKEAITLESRTDRVCFDNLTRYFEAPYTVQEGDTFASIAQKYFADPAYAETIAKANGRPADARLQPDTYLRIPVKRFCMLYDPDQADFQRRQIDAFVAATRSQHKLTYSWAGKLDLPGGTITLEDLIGRVFVPSRLVISWMENDKVGLSLSFAAGSWLEAHGGDLIIDWISPIGIKLAIGSGGTEGFIRRNPREFLEEYQNLEKAGQTAEMREMVGREAPVVFETVIKLLITALQYREAGEVRAADDNLRTAESMAQFFPPKLGQAGMRALVNSYAGWSPDQLAERNRAIAGLEASGKAIRQGSVSAAFAPLGEALEQFHRLGDGPAEYNAYVNLAEAYKLANDYEKMQEVLAAARRIALGYGDISNGARLMGMYGFAFALRDNYGEALRVLKEALAEFQVAKLASRDASIHRYLGIVYGRMGDYDSALYHNQRAFLIAQNARRWGQGREDERSILFEQADVYTLMREFGKALEICDKLVDFSEKENDVDLTLEANYRKGTIYQLMGRDDDAIASFSFVLKRGEEISQPPKDSWLSLIDVRHKWKDEGKVLAYMGRSYYRKADYNNAVRKFHEGLTYYSEKKDTFGIIETNAWLGLSYIKQGFPDDAIQRFKFAREESQRIGIREQDWELLYGIAQAHLAAGRLEQALQYFKEADRVIDRKFATRSWYAEESVRGAVEVKREFYLRYAGLLLALNRQHPARYDRELFTVAEKAKSIVFQESIAKASASNTLDQTPEFMRELAAERMMISRVSQLASQAAAGVRLPDADAPASMQSAGERLMEAESTLSTQQRSLERRFKPYANLKRPKPLAVKDLQAILKDNETVLSYLVREEDTLVFVVGRRSFHVPPPLPVGRPQVEELVGKFRIGIDRIMTPDGIKPMTDDPGDLAQFDPAAAHALYESLFRPAEAWIPRQKGSKLYIAADGSLYTIPFEALIDKLKQVDMDRFHQVAEESRTGKLPFLSQYAQLHYLIDTYAIAYVPAASVLRSLRLRPRPAPRSGREPLIAFADPVFEAGDADGEPDGPAELPRRRMLELYLKRLKESGNEAGDIAKLLGGRKKYILLRDKASEANVHRFPLRNARYLLFATHGLLGGDFQGAIHEPSLVLSQAGNPPEYDGLLGASEVYSLELNADAVILSACNTYGADAAGRRGEGFAGFTRAFMYAGASALLITHWEVEADATRQLLVSTFRKKGSLVNALRDARLAMRGESVAMAGAPTIRLSRSHPFFWAAFVYVGQ